MSDLNQCQFIGRLGADPETKYTQGGSAITNIRIACGWKTKDKEGTEWVPIVFFGRLAEVAGEYLRKGSQVYVSGRFTTQSWEKDGQKRYRSEVVADRLQMLGKTGNTSDSTAGRTSEVNSGVREETGGFDDDSDIPF